MLSKDSIKTVSQGDDSKENPPLSTRSKLKSTKYGDDDAQFVPLIQRNNLQEMEGNLNCKIHERSESTTLHNFHTKGSNFSGVPSSPRRGSQILQDLEDAQAIADKIDQPKEIVKAFENYQPKNKDIDLVALRKSEKSKIKKYKSCVYLGEFINGKRHGKGIMISVPLKIYEGDWENDVKHGKGLEILEQGSRYEGEYINGKPEGFGTFLWANGETYEGEWKNGLKHGSGMWKGTKGESYLGEWKYGKAEGYGVHTWRNGDRYEGELKGFLKHGHGTEKFVNGDYYVGTYANGKPDGFGEYFWVNGCHYKGDFKNGLRHGKGTWRKGQANSDFYEGEWANDKKNGVGVYQWLSGNKYVGSYFDDIRHGYGEMYWLDGSAYKGFWEKGIQHGEGQLIVPGKGTKRGIFENNMLIDEIRTETTNDMFEPRETNYVLKESNHQYTGILGTPRSYVPQSLSKSPRKGIANLAAEQNRQNDLCLPEIKAIKGNNFPLPPQYAQKRRNSSSIGPRRNIKEKDSIVKANPQYASVQGSVQQGPRRLQNLASLGVNEQIKRSINSVKGRSMEK